MKYNIIELTNNIEELMKYVEMLIIHSLERIVKNWFFYAKILFAFHEQPLYQDDKRKNNFRNQLVYKINLSFTNLLLKEMKKYNIIELTNSIEE